MAHKSSAERAQYVAECMAVRKREPVAQIVLYPSGNHEVEITQTGNHYALHLSLGEAVQAVNLLQKAISELRFEGERQRDVLRVVRKGVEL